MTGADPAPGSTAATDHRQAPTDGTDVALLDILWPALLGPPAPASSPGLPGDVELTGPTRSLPSAYAVDALATATVAAATAAVAELVAVRTPTPAPHVTVDRRHAAVAFRRERYLTAVGWDLPAIWDPIAGDYETDDGWIKLHTNYDHHRDAVLAVLDVRAERGAVTTAVRAWSGDALETAVVDAGGCAAVLRSTSAWRAHPQGLAVANEPLVAVATEPVAIPTELTSFPPATAADARTAPFGPAPLQGVRVLDLTRVIAGPLATSLLAAYGAEVLRIDPPGFDEVGALLGDITAGKHRAALDLREAADRDVFTQLVAGAHVIVHGYRSDALSSLGFDTGALRAINPALVVVSHDAYGWTGPWATRRGFDSLVQMSCGIADRGRQVIGQATPSPLPAQALDHGTGYLLAAAATRALTRLLTEGVTSDIRLSLARTARLLDDLGDDGDIGADELTPGDVEPWLEDAVTDFGPVRRVSLPGRIGGWPPSWSVPAGPLGVHRPAWPSGH